MVKLFKYIFLSGGEEMGIKKWIISDYDKSLAKELANECEIDPIVALIASSRGYTDPMDLEQFLSDEPVFSDPFEMTDIELAANRIINAIDKKEKIVIFGDYDCDGVTATALLCKYLRAKEADCDYYIPDRFCEGYGMNETALRTLCNNGYKLIISVDNGIVSFNEAKLAKELGADLIITDHHLPSDTLPDAFAVVDPYRKDCMSTFKSICGAQVVFRLICVMEQKEPEELLPYFADILSLAVLGDIMPLTLENRSIVKFGVKKIKTSALTGISALLNVAGISADSVTANKISYGLVPRINAAGRMGKAERAVELLLCENMLTALNIANEIDNENVLRQQTEKKILSEAINIIEENGYMHNRIIVVSGKEWHHGVVGIVAAKLTEKYGCPTILLADDGKFAIGSGRSIEGFSLFSAINSVRDLTVKFGGHELAAGVTIKSSDIAEFRMKINQYADEQDFVPPVLNLDCKLNPSALNLDLCFALNMLEPFGPGNPVPLFGLYGVELKKITPIGNNKHLRLIFSKGSNSFQGLLFGITPDSFCFNIGDILDLAINVESNYYNGDYSVSVQIKAIRMNGADDEKLFNDISNFNDFCSGKSFIADNLLPSREEVGTVYRYICEKTVLTDRVKYFFVNTLGYGKVSIILKILEELDLIINKNGRITAKKDAVKTNLINSATYKKLLERSGKNDRTTP